MNKNKSENDLTTILSGVAGEYFVAAELSARGYIASITLRNTKGIDIVCANADASKSVALQVKTNKRSNRDWVLNQKCEQYVASNLFYIFVNLNDNLKSPDYFIVPSKIVAEHITESHKSWLEKPGRNGEIHNDTTMRKFSDYKEEYLNRWDLLGL